MGDDGRMNGQDDYTRDSVKEKLAGATDQPLMNQTRLGEENSANASNDHDIPSPTAAYNTSYSNGSSGKESVAQRREAGAANSSPRYFAPPSTPLPHYGFRRKTTNAIMAGRRVLHHRSPVPDIEENSRAEQEGFSQSLDIDQLSGRRLSGRSTVDTEKDYYNEAVGRFSRDARRGSGGGLDSGLSSSMAPGTLPSSNGGAFKYNKLRKYGGERIFQMDDDEAAAMLLGESPSASLDVDRRTGYRYHAQGTKARGSSAPTIVEPGSSTQSLSPDLGRLDPETPTTVDINTASAEGSDLAAVEPKLRRERRSGKEEKKRRHHSSRHSRTSTSGGFRGGNAEATSEPMSPLSSAWFSGMTTAQQSRFETLQEHSSPGHELARWKMLELLRHWMSAQGTRSSVEAVIRDVLVDAGLAKVKEAWVGAGSESGGPGQCRSFPPPQFSEGGGPATATGTGKAEATECETAAAASPMIATPPTSEPPPEKISPKNQLIARTVTPVTPPAQEEVEVGKNEGAKAKEQALRQTTDEKATAGSSSSLTLVDGAANDCGAPTPPKVETASSASSMNSTSATNAAQPSVSPHRRQLKKDSSAAATAKDGGSQQTSPVAQAASPKEDSSSDVKRVKEREGVLPPTDATPEKQIASAAQDNNGVSPKADAPLDETHGTRPFSETTTPQQTPSEIPFQRHRTSDAALRRSRSRSSSFKEAAKRQAATHDEIPRFYFPLGRPTKGAQAINGPLSKKHENPHLKVVEGVPIAAAMYHDEESNVLSANAEALISGATEEAEIPSEARRGPKVAPMSNLHLLEEKQVAHYIRREFGRLPPFPKHSLRVRLLGGRMRSGSHHNSNLPYAKQELLYKQQFIQCVQRICNQCFGVPRYFAFIILRLIHSVVNNGAVDASGEGGRPHTRHTSSSRMGSSSSLLSQVTNGANGTGSSSTLPSIFHITPQHLKDFYDTHLKNKDAIRRVFDLLILSSRLPSSAAAASSLAATNAAAATLVAAEQSDVLGPPGIEAALLRPYLLPQDFVAYIDVLLAQHPGLAFLRQTPDFQTKYLDTVIYRIFYELDRFDRGRIRYSELAASRLIDAFRQVDAAEDINSVLLFFSYEHFYVLYCRFWELDEDRDLLLAPEDLMRYAPEEVMNPVIVQRVFAGVGRRLRCTAPQRIGYEDFVWFCLSEEDKSTPQAIRYWFRVLDLDGDGVLSVYELRAFYDATRDKIAQYVQEGLVSFEDVVRQVFDMMRCPEVRGLYLSDLLREPEAAAVALDMLTNVVKFLQFEQRDPFVAHQERLLAGLEQSAWDRFARMEYDRMALETDEEG